MTASGKSDVAMRVAARVDGAEIVAVDAMQVYRGMDIGTAKPTAADRAAVAHHGLDLADPADRFTVAEYQRAILPVVESSPNPQILVAGTGLYLTALLDGLELPGEYPAVRAELDADDDTSGLHARLARLDPVAARRIEPANRRRIVRALEVTIGSARPFSSYGSGVATYPAHGVPMIGIRRTRPETARRVAARVERMLEDGLVDEVRSLLERPGGLSPTAAQALGYKELIAHLDGAVSLDHAVADIVLRTRQFAVRQERWFRRDPRLRWLDVRGDDLDGVIEAVTAALTR